MVAILIDFTNNIRRMPLVGIIKLGLYYGCDINRPFFASFLLFLLSKIRF